jgi:hypothetical protein
MTWRSVPKATSRTLLSLLPFYQYYILTSSDCKIVIELSIAPGVSEGTGRSDAHAGNESASEKKARIKFIFVYTHSLMSAN